MPYERRRSLDNSRRQSITNRRRESIGRSRRPSVTSCQEPFDDSNVKRQVLPVECPSSPGFADEKPVTKRRSSLSGDGTRSPSADEDDDSYVKSPGSNGTGPTATVSDDDGSFRRQTPRPSTESRDKSMRRQSSRQRSDDDKVLRRQSSRRNNGIPLSDDDNSLKRQSSRRNHGGNLLSDDNRSLHRQSSRRGNRTSSPFYDDDDDRSLGRQSSRRGSGLSTSDHGSSRSSKGRRSSRLSSAGISSVALDSVQKLHDEPEEKPPCLPPYPSKFGPLPGLLMGDLWCDEGKVVFEAIRQLANYAEPDDDDGDERELINELGGPYTIISVMMKWHRSIVITIDGLRALANLGANSAFRDAAYCYGGMDVTLLAMKNYPKDKYVQRNGCAAICRFCSNMNQNSIEFVEEYRGLDSLVHALEMFATDMTLVNFAVSALYGISSIEQLRRSIIESGIVAPLSRVSETVKERDDSKELWMKSRVVLNNIID